MIRILSRKENRCGYSDAQGGLGVSHRLVFVALFLLLCPCSTSWGQLDPDSNVKKVLAKVGAWEISRASVDRYIKNVVPVRRLNSSVIAKLTPVALDQLIDRQIILDYLKTKSKFSGPNEIKLELTLLKRELEKVGKTLDSHLEEHRISLAELENELAWKISWGRYLETYLTDSNLVKFYNLNPRHYDGTQIKVAHILFRGRGKIDGLRDKAIGVKAAIASGELSWTDAVQRYSDANSSKTNGGIIGWIEIDKPMSEEFSEAAFKLDPGQISQPIQTNLGFHVIKCLELKPGNRGPLDTREKLIRDATQFLFKKLAADHRSNVDVKRF